MSDEPKNCRACNAPLDHGLRYCTKCSTWQTRGPRSVAFLRSLATWITTLGAAYTAIASGWIYVSGDHSRTQCRVTTADANEVHVSVWNTGKKPSLVTGVHLTFDDDPKHELPLQSKDVQQMLITDKPVELAFVLTDERLMPGNEKQTQSTQPQMNTFRRDQPFASQRMTLCMDVVEDGWWWTGGLHKRCDHFPASRIVAFVEGMAKP